MTTPAPAATTATPALPTRNILTDAATVLTDLGGNDLIGRLWKGGLGKQLSAVQIDHVVAIVEAIEGVRPAETGEPLPPRTPAPIA